MTRPIVGLTHDVVLFVNNSTFLGITVKPATMRVLQAPTFVPSFSVGAPSGVDLTRWKAFAQARFDGGAGQVYLSAEQGNNRYAESNLIDIGLPVTVVGGQAGRDDPLTAASVPGGPLDDDPVGDVQTALRPMATTAATPLATLFTNAYRVFVHMFNDHPIVFHNKSILTYTNIAEPNVWEGSLLGHTRDALRGSWAMHETGMDGRIRSVTAFSNMFAIAQGPKGIRLWHPNTGIQEPSFSTKARIVHVYDSKLWVAHDNSGSIGYYDPANDSFSTPTMVGQHASIVNNMCTFAGKLYIGKVDSLWVFEGGRMYQIEDFSDSEDPWNFSVMVEHRGAMYFNIGQRMYRISANNLLELLQIPLINGVLTSGASIGGELYMVAREPDGEGRVFIFNTETGGTRQWFRTDDICYKVGSADRAPSSIQGAGGYVWMAPMYMSAAYSAGGKSSPIVAVNRALPSLGASIPHFAKTHSYLLSSMFDFGLPEVEKQFDKLIVDYTLYSSGDRIDVSYLTALKSPQLLNFRLNDESNAAVDLSDGSTSETGFDETVEIDDIIYVGFRNRPKYVRFIVDEDLAEAVTYNVQYYNGSWVTINTDLTDMTVGLTASNFFTLGTLSGWTKNTVEGITAYHLRLVATFAGRVVMREVDGIASLEKQNWLSLGSCTNIDDVRQEMSFPSVTTGYQIMFKFDTFGTDTSRPDMRRFTVKYANIGKPYLNVHFAALAIDNIALLNLEKENSAHFIQEALFSMAGHGKTFVASLPYPHPIGHTRRMKVSIGPTGAMVPILAYTHTSSGSNIPVILEEM